MSRKVDTVPRCFCKLMALVKQLATGGITVRLRKEFAHPCLLG